MTVSEAELCRLAAIVTAEREDLPEQGLPPSLLSDLMEQIHCDAITFQGMDSRQQEYWFLQGFPEDDEPDPELARTLDHAHWQHYWDSLNCSYPDRRPAQRDEENIFSRLQVTSRTAAVFRAFPDQVA